MIRVPPTSSCPADMSRDAGSPLAKRPNWLLLSHLISFGGLAAFVVALLALHGLRGALNPLQHTVSEYSLGSYGWLMRAAFVALGLGVLATAMSLHLMPESSSWRPVGLLLLACTAIGLFLDAGYNTDHPRVPETVDGTVHGVGMLIICLTLPAATFALGFDLARKTSAARVQLLRSLGVAELFAILGYKMSTIASRGLTERVAIAIAVATLVLLRSLAVSRTRGGVAPPPSLTRIRKPSSARTSALSPVGDPLMRARRTK